MLTVIRVNSENKDFIMLVKLLDAYLKKMDGDEHSFYAQYNKTTMIKHVVVCYADNLAVGCGAFKQFDKQTAEIKRMFVLPEQRGQGIGQKILQELEHWATEENYTQCILETGKRQHQAIALYTKSGYHTIPNFGQYAGVENSVCMRKILSL